MQIPDNWTVFPLHGILFNPLRCKCGNVTCKNFGKHPKYKWSTLGPGEKAPIGEGDGLGLATGVRSGVVIVDLDLKPEEGKDGLTELEKLVGKEGIPDTLLASTPSGGSHIYFQWPGFPVKNSVDEIAYGIDIRGDGGYAVLPNTLHKSGGRYEYLNWGTPIAPMPAWLAARVARSPGGEAKAPFPVPLLPTGGAIEAEHTSMAGYRMIERLCHRLAQVPLGRRNTQLFSICAQLGDHAYVGDITLADARNAVLVTITDAGWDVDDKTLCTIENGLTKGRNRQHTMVVIDHLQEKCNDIAITGLGAREDVYVVGNFLSRDIGGSMCPLAPATLAEVLSSCVDWRLKGKEGDLIKAPPPPWAVSAIFARGKWDGLRLVEGVAKGPVMRPDGTFATEEGYDAATRTVLTKSYKLPKYTLEEAVEVLNDLVCDFPFLSPSHKGSFICSILTPLALYAYKGPSPLFLFEASTAGSGKTLLANIAGLISTGEFPSVSSYPDSDEEMRKRLTSIAMRPAPITFFDNIGKGKKLGGPSLCAALTTPDRIWKDRVLGGNTEFKGPLSTVFYATSNNTEIAEDMHRRVVNIRLVPDCELPEQRSGFKYPMLVRHVLNHIDELMGAAATVLTVWHDAGRPYPKGRTWGSYEGWHHMVVGALEHAGWTSPDDAVRDLVAAQQEDDATELVPALAELWDKRKVGNRSLTTKEMHALAFPRGGIGTPEDGAAGLREYLDGEFPKGCTVKMFGYLLRKINNKVVGRCKVVGDKVNNMNAWKVVMKK